MKHVDQYLNKFPENEKFLGFENVSTPILSIFIVLAFKYLLRKLSSLDSFPLHPIQRISFAVEAMQQR